MTPFPVPNPNTTYASSALIAWAALAFGTTNTNDCTGPLNAFTVAGGVAVVQLSAKTIGMPSCTGAPAASGVQVGTAPAAASQLGSAGMYDRFCFSGVPL